VLSVVRVDVIFRFQASAETDHRGLFSEIEMAIATYTSPGVHLSGFLFKATDQQHLVIVANESVAIFSLRQCRGGAITHG